MINFIFILRQSLINSIKSHNSKARFNIKYCCVFLLLFTCACLAPLQALPQAQKHINTRQQLWLGLFNQTRLSNKLGVWTDLHYRQTGNFLDDPFQLLLRFSGTWFFKDNLRLHVGYAYIHHFPNANYAIARPEHRPWQQIWWSQKYNGYNILQWLRFEQRNVRRATRTELLNTYNFNFRLRYNFSLFIPITRKELIEKTPFVAIIDEVFINFGKQIVYNYFDQNRFFVGLGYQFTSHLNVQAGYMNLFQQEASGSNFLMNHSARIFLFHSLDLRKKESPVVKPLE